VTKLSSNARVDTAIRVTSAKDRETIYLFYRSRELLEFDQDDDGCYSDGSRVSDPYALAENDDGINADEDDQENNSDKMREESDDGDGSNDHTNVEAVSFLSRKSLAATATAFPGHRGSLNPVGVGSREMLISNIKSTIGYSDFKCLLPNVAQLNMTGDE
jgi:hypothetical protein